MSTEHLQTEQPALSYEKWKAELIQVTSRESNIPVEQVRIDDRGAYEWWRDGFTPYVTFRENFSPTGGYLK